MLKIRLMVFEVQGFEWGEGGYVGWKGTSKKKIGIFMNCLFILFLRVRLKAEAGQSAVVDLIDSWDWRLDCSIENTCLHNRCMLPAI